MGGKRRETRIDKVKGKGDSMKQKYLQIQYDKRDLKIYKWLWIITGIMTILGLIPCLIYGNKTVRETVLIEERLFEVGMLLIYFGGTLFLGFTFKFFKAAGYLRRLEKYGYILPEKKESYENNISLLVQNAEQGRDLGNKKSCTGIILTIIAGVFTIFTVIYNFTMTKVPHFIAILVFIIMTALFARQIFPGKFRDDVDIFGNVNRKVRKNLPDGILEMLIVFMVLMFFLVKLTESIPVTRKGIFYHQAIRYEKIHNHRFDLFPDDLPKDAKEGMFNSGYKIFWVSFYTSTEKIENYMEMYGKSEGLTEIYTFDNNEEFARHLESARAYLHTMTATSGNQNCYLYVFDKDRFFVLLNKETGYVWMYWGGTFQWE